MKVKSEKRLLAEKLRKELGYSYSEISERTGVSKGTLSHWLKHIALTLEQEQRIQQRVEDNQSAFVSQAREINQRRFKAARRDAFQSGVESIANLSMNNEVHELALAMLYLGEGDKTGNRVQIANTNSDVLQYFLWAVETVYGIDRADMTLRLNLVEIARPHESRMKTWWANQLSCSLSQFIKTQFDQRSQASELTGDYHGVCTITYNDTYLYERLVGVYSTYMDRAK